MVMAFFLSILKFFFLYLREQNLCINWNVLILSVKFSRFWQKKKYPLITHTLIKRKSIPLTSQSPLLSLPTETHGETAMWRWTDTTVSPGTARVDGHHRRKEEARKDSPQSSGASLALPTPWLWTSSLQNCGIIHFYCFKLFFSAGWKSMSIC